MRKIHKLFSYLKLQFNFQFVKGWCNWKAHYILLYLHAAKITQNVSFQSWIVLYFSPFLTRHTYFIPIPNLTVPDAPEALRALQITTSQVKLGWSPPEFDNGALKGYYVYNGKHQVESISELSCIVSGLSPGTSYDLCVSKPIDIENEIPDNS